jgi:hypothetical protein
MLFGGLLKEKMTLTSLTLQHRYFLIKRSHREMFVTIKKPWLQIDFIK